MLERNRAGNKQWAPIGDHHDAGGLPDTFVGWSKAGRFVVVRQRVHETKAQLRRTLLDLPGYTLRVWAANRIEGVRELWRDYSQWANVEQRIKGLAHDLAAEVFSLQSLSATESAFLAVLCALNLLGC